MPNIKPTKQALALAEALTKRGVKFELEHWDGHKHIDLRIPDIKLCIEIDGLQHYTNPKQFMADLVRDHYSDDAGYRTKHISNEHIETHCEEIAEAIRQIAT